MHLKLFLALIGYSDRCVSVCVLYDADMFLDHKHSQTPLHYGN